MAISLPDARMLSDDVLQALRLRALRGCELGFTEADVANLLGVSRETVSRWWSAYSSQGLDALPQERSGRPLGSGRLLSDQQARHIQGLLDNHSPEDLGIAAPLWNRRAVRDLIRKEFAIDLAVRTVARTSAVGGIPRRGWLGGGLSHLLEHLVAGGSNGRRTEEQNRDLLQKIGNNSNAYTTDDHTAFFVNTTKEHMEEAVDLVTGWMLTAAITPAEYRREYRSCSASWRWTRAIPIASV